MNNIRISRVQKDFLHNPLWFWEELWQPVALNNQAVNENVRAWIAQYSTTKITWKDWQNDIQVGFSARAVCVDRQTNG